MMSLWWWALPIVLLPILWHRQKREQTQAAPLATARFLPQSAPVQLRVWHWTELLLLTLRCLLLLALIALLADPVLPWRGDSVLVVPGADPAFVDRQVREAGLAEARRIDLPGRDAFQWLHEHEREFKPQARLLLVGDVAMPAVLPRLRHPLTLRTQAVPPASSAQSDFHVAVHSRRAAEWRKLFAALDGPRRYVLDEQAASQAALVIWDLPQAPPAGLRAPLWWIADASAFPELAKAPHVDGLRYLDSPRGRLWSAAWLPPQDAEGARTMFDTWQRLHAGVLPYTAPPQAPLVDAHAPAGPSGGPSSGALRDMLAAALLVLFALERMLSHVRRR
jgi:hypothetical protein